MEASLQLKWASLEWVVNKIGHNRTNHQVLTKHMALKDQAVLALLMVVLDNISKLSHNSNSSTLVLFIQHSIYHLSQEAHHSITITNQIIK